MLSKNEIEQLTADEQIFYENAGMFDRAKMEPALREKARRRATERGADLDAAPAEGSEVHSNIPGAKEYKVFTSQDKGLFGKFDPESIEAALNAYARQGWVVVTSATATFRGIVAARDELIIILERTK